MTYPAADVRFNPGIYSNPDPSWYFPEKAEDEKAPHTHLGWRTARHLCSMSFERCDAKEMLSNMGSGYTVC